MATKKPAETAPVQRLVMPLLVWKKMTPDEYATQHHGFGKHVAVTQEIVTGCQEVWVFLGPTVEFAVCDSLPRCPYCDSDEWEMFTADYDNCLGCHSLLDPV